MELFDGQLFVHLNLGTGAAKVRASRKPLNDGNWHRVELTLKVIRRSLSRTYVPSLYDLGMLIRSTMVLKNRFAHM